MNEVKYLLNALAELKYPEVKKILQDFDAGKLGLKQCYLCEYFFEEDEGRLVNVQKISGKLHDYQWVCEACLESD